MMADMNIWIGNQQSQVQANSFASHVTNRCKLRRNPYSHIRSCLFFTLRSKHLHPIAYSIYGIVYLPYLQQAQWNSPMLMACELNETVHGVSLVPIADPYIHTNVNDRPRQQSTTKRLSNS